MGIDALDTSADTVPPRPLRIALLAVQHLSPHARLPSLAFTVT